MRFSFIEPHLKTCGGIRRIVELSNHLVERGHKVTIYHPSGEKCQWLPCRALTKKLSLIEQDRHEILIYNYPPQNKFFSQTPAKLKIYYLLHAYHIVYDKESVLPTYRQPHVLKVACSQWVEKSVREFIGSKLPVMYGGINRNIFHPVPGRKKEVDVVFYGSKRRWKGTDTILKACEIGNFSYDFYEGKNLPQEKLADFITKGRVFASGSWYEGWNNCSLEAMACGMPVITTDCGGCREFAINGVTALLAPPQDPIAMAAGIELLLKNPQLRQDLAAQGYKKSLIYDWGRFAKDWGKLVKQHL